MAHYHTFSLGPEMQCRGDDVSHGVIPWVTMQRVLLTRLAVLDKPDLVHFYLNYVACVSVG